ncbi:hypothetical protein PRZ48_009660 [Zasmidium cellare]|uniref:Siderophore iron transporter mirB n=1 Tax=Zasmidium cellare TaxID=395010 RepID=A0ABR0EDK6_ZASCE|nr:hypothetical protein PRZ48_009660 [Zasmidium cellare]
MGITSRFNHQPQAAEVTTTPSLGQVTVDEKDGARETSQQVSSDDESEHLQGGIKEADAITKLWTWKHLVAAYILIWIINFMLPFAKLIDIWGRTQCFGLGIGFTTLGLILMAACTNVQTYAAAQIFYTCGYNMISFVMNIFIVDTSTLRNRALMFALSATPYLATMWAYGPAAQHIIAPGGIGFRWGFGIWAILYPIFCSPLFGLFWYYHVQAKKAGMISQPKGNRTWKESFIYYAREFDVIGLILISAGLALFLLPFSIYSYQAEQWRSPLIICLIVFGVLLIICFALYEKYLAPVTFVPWPLLKNRTVFFTFAMVGSLYTAWYIWDNYFYSFLIVVFDLSVQDATYITNIYTIGSTFWAVVVGVMFRYWGRIKWHAVLFGAPLTLLGNALMIPFRQPNSPVGLIVLCQVFIALGGATLVMCEQMTVQAVSKRKDIPALLATEGMVALIGGSVGSTIAAAMWTGIFPAKLAKHLPADAQSALASIYADITVQSGYPVGSPTRTGINQAYGDTQKLMLIASSCLNVITLAMPMLWEDVNVRTLDQQVSGVVV